MRNKDILRYIVTLVVATVLVFIGYRVTQSSTESQEGEYLSAKVISVDNIEIEEISFDGGTEAMENKKISFTAEILKGEEKSKTVSAEQYIDNMYPVPKKEIAEGDRIIIYSREYIDGDLSTGEWNFTEYDKSSQLIFLVAIFFGLILLVGRKKGLATIISLTYTLLAIFTFYIPSILRGYNIYLTTTIVSIYIILISLILLSGVNKKTLCAVLGNIGGVVIAGLLGVFFSRIMDITGVVSEDHVFLMQLDSGVSIDLKAIVWGSIVIGALGAIMDVSMSIASAMNEISETMEQRSFGKMLKAGMNIGKDAIGTMTNTLILAYIGGSLATVLILTAYNKSTLYLLSTEMIVVEFIQSIAGSIGIIFAVPATALFAAYIFNLKHRK